MLRKDGPKKAHILKQCEKCDLGALAGCLGRILEALGAVLEALGGFLEALENVSESHEVVLEAMLGQDKSKQPQESETFFLRHKETQCFLASRGGVLEISWRLFGAFWKPLKASFRPLGASWTPR